MPNGDHVRNNPTALFTQFPSNGRIPFKQILQATWVAILSLILGICFVLAIVFSADGKPTNENTWYQYVPTFIALGAVVLRGSVAALLGMTIYQNLWANIAAPGEVGKEEGGTSLRKIEGLHLASRLAVGMFAYPSYKVAWIVGVLGLVITSAIQPVLQSAITVRQEKHVVPTSVPIFHPQFNGSLAYSDGAQLIQGGATTIPKRAAIAALLGEKNALIYTIANVTGVAKFGPVKYLDVNCSIQAVPGAKSNAANWDVYNFTYRYPDATPFPGDPEFDLTQFRDVSNLTALYTAPEISTDSHSRVQVKATLWNNTHYLYHLCNVQTAIGNCATSLTAGVGNMGDVTCERQEFTNVDNDLGKPFSYNGPAAAVPALFESFLKVFVGKAVLDIHGRLNAGQSLFMLGTLAADTNTVLTMPSDLLSHMQRVLWVMPLLSKFGTDVQDKLTVPMSVSDERTDVVYKIDRPRAIAVLAVLAVLSLKCLTYLCFSRSGSGRLTRDSLVHSLTVAGLNGPAVKGACAASLEEVLDKAGDERLRYGVLIEATDAVSGHLGFVDQGPFAGGHGNMILGKPAPGRWYGGQARLRKPNASAEDVEDL